MFKLYDGENNWTWNPFAYGFCERTRNPENGKLSALGAWVGYPFNSLVGNFPNKKQIGTVTCREYTRCPVAGDYNYMRLSIDHDQVSISCEPYNDIDIGCRR